MNPIHFEPLDAFVNVYLPGEATPVEVHWQGLYGDWPAEKPTP